ncbi:hypothetical protein B0T25DRAFT_25489 [Lasiosphaeria hispida]|uniref:Uncharacterized protein n=1 Tax=Lasiosphaeria hispida TaxID=260671 RepID=A0AAJ0HU60_9PEZI|nr:hypothetical protein B0T25DRAFT_25489 [Lasiosphaeria hispida]
MRGFTRVAIAAAVAAGVSAQPHNHHQHQHLHRHVSAHAQSPVEKREGAVVVTEIVKGPTVVEYVLGGEKIDEKKAKEGIDKGLYVVMGTSTPSFTAPPPVISTSTGSGPNGGQFFEQKTSSAAPSSSSAAPPPPASSSATSSAAPDSAPAGGGVDSDFPSGKVPCSQVPSDYGAVAVPWAADGGWTTLMRVGKLIKGVALNNIEQPKGMGCAKGFVCSYACPPGFQKTQWPEDSQGATGQSVGGLYCNDDGFLELTRPSHTKLCEPGAGGVFVRNELSSNAAICRTDYPGNEAMTIPLDTSPGNTYPLANPVSSSYYKWQGKSTTAQYYANNEGVSVEQACTWDSSEFPDSAGNWAPTNIGVGKDDSGITYLSIFPNLPTSHAVLNYNIEIEGDYSGECWLRNGVYAKANGCTIGIKDGGSATLVFKKA